MIASAERRASLEHQLDSLIHLIEHHSPAMRCSVLLLDTDGVTLRHGAAPRLPEQYCRSIDGLHIGAGAGSCGTAAFTRETTIVADIATHEYWVPYRQLALPFNLRACWSTPIFGAENDCIGTFAMYYDQPREPSPQDISLIETASQLASAIIERESLLAWTAESNEQLQENALELETLNQQLQENAVELEMQAEALECANVDLRESREEAEAANRAKSKFLATMSHELRTPLNAIGGYADLLLAGVRGELTAGQTLDVERIQRSGRHLLGLIDDILNFATLEAGRVEFKLADLAVAPILASIEELLRPAVDAKSILFVQRMEEPELALRGDEDKVRRIVLNLLTNATKFTDDGGSIALICDAVDGYVRFRVTDTGCGIPETHLQRVFEPFVQVDRDRATERQGVGLGLSISRELAHAMGGSITATSTLGQGSTFTLLLPQAEGVAVEDSVGGQRLEL